MKKFILAALVLGALGLFFTGCQNEKNTLKVAATSVPHADLLEIIKPELESRGIHLKIVEVDDYNLPNRLLFEGQVDANFFQHKPFLDEQNQRFNYHLKPLVAVHIEPLGLYSQIVSSIETLSEGSTIAIPCDPTNEARALVLLQEVGLIKLKSCSDNQLATVYDIEENAKHLKIEEVDAAFLPRALADVDLAVIPANFALQAHLEPVKDALVLESSNSPYANLIVIRETDEEREDLHKLKEVLTSDKMRKTILEKYKGSILPAA